MIISWLQLHGNLERKTYWLLVLFITNAWREIKHKGQRKENSGRMLYAQLHGRTKKASQTSAPSTDDLGNPAAAMEGTCFLRLTPVAIPPPPPATAVVLEAPSWASTVKIRLLETPNKYNSKIFQIFKLHWFYLLREGEKEKSHSWPGEGYYFIFFKCSVLNNILLFIYWHRRKTNFGI